MAWGIALRDPKIVKFPFHPFLCEVKIVKFLFPKHLPLPGPPQQLPSPRPGAVCLANAQRRSQSHGAPGDAVQRHMPQHRRSQGPRAAWDPHACGGSVQGAVSREGSVRCRLFWWKTGNPNNRIKGSCRFHVLWGLEHDLQVSFAFQAWPRTFVAARIGHGAQDRVEGTCLQGATHLPCLGKQKEAFWSALSCWQLSCAFSFQGTGPRLTSLGCVQCCLTLENEEATLGASL